MKALSQKIMILLTIAWYTAIWVVSSIPSDSLPSYEILSMDKLAHFFVYFVLGMLVNKTAMVKGFGRKTVYYIYGFLLVSALAEEYHQHFIPGRSVTIWDFLANSTGLIAAFVVYIKYYDKSR